MSFEKIIKIILSEIVEALLFSILIAIVSAFPENSVKQDIIKMLISFWGIAGLATPFVIWFEVENEILKIFGK